MYEWMDMKTDCPEEPILQGTTDTCSEDHFIRETDYRHAVLILMFALFIYVNVLFSILYIKNTQYNF